MHLRIHFLLLSICALLFILTPGAMSRVAADEQYPTADNPLVNLAPEHPRLFATEQDFRHARERLATTTELNDRYQRLKQKADKYLDEPISTYEIPDGKRLLEVSRTVLKRVETLAYVYRMSGEEQYFDRAWAELEAAAKFPDWNPSHFLDTAEMTAAFAIGYDWLYADLSEQQRTLLRDAIVTKGLEPARVEYQNDSWWTESNFNWNPVCNSGIALGAMAVADEEPELAGEILAAAINSLAHGLVGYAPDGGWDEGPVYWSYGTKYIVSFLAAAETALGSDFDLTETPGLSATGFFPIYITSPIGKTFNYSDGGDHTIGDRELYWLARTFDQPAFAAFRREQRGWSTFDLLWYDERGDTPGAMGLPRDRVFHSAEVATMRSTWDDPDAIFAGLKAGNNTQGHEQLDIGTFILDALGERWAIELGADNYNLSGYFSDKRYNYYRIRAEGQNTLVMNPGREPDQSQTMDAPIFKFEPTSDEVFAIADLTPAYERHAQRVWRGVTLQEDRSQVLLQDEIEANEPAELWWFMHTQAAVEIESDGTTAVLSQNGKRLWARIVAGPDDAEFTVMDAEPLPTSPVGDDQDPNRDIRKLTIHLTDVEDTRLAVLFVPLDENEEPLTGMPQVEPLEAWSAFSHKLTLPMVMR